MLARAEGDVQLLQQKVKDLDVLMGTQWDLNGNSMGTQWGTRVPPKWSFFDGRNRDLYGINMMGLIMRSLALWGYAILRQSHLLNNLVHACSYLT